MAGCGGGLGGAGGQSPHWASLRGFSSTCSHDDINHHTKWGSLAGLTVKREDVTELAPTGNLAFKDESSFRFDSLLLLFGPDDGQKEKHIINTGTARFGLESHDLDSGHKLLIRWISLVQCMCAV